MKSHVKCLIIDANETCWMRWMHFFEASSAFLNGGRIYIHGYIYIYILSLYTKYHTRIDTFVVNMIDIIAQN